MHFRNILLAATGETASRTLSHNCRGYVPDVLQAEIIELAHPAWARKIGQGTPRGRGYPQASAVRHFGMTSGCIEAARLVTSS